MGLGDEIMVSALARRARRESQSDRRVVVHDRLGRPRWSNVWLHNPDFVQPTESEPRALVVTDGPGHRRYIKGKTALKWEWQSWNAEPGRIMLSADEQALAALQARRVIVEPHIKAKASPNKDWGWFQWTKFQRLASDAGIRLTQLGDHGRLLTGVDYIYTATPRDAFAIISTAKAVVTTEGALHHAAAAFGTPSVVIFGGYISPEITGYAGHANLYAGGEPCGMRYKCEHCSKAMADITPELVFQKLMEILK